MNGLWLPPLAAALMASIATPAVMSVLRRWNVVDVASDRSSHQGPALRGVGVATLIGVVIGLLFGSSVVGDTSLWALTSVGLASVLGGTLGLVEDVRGLPVRARALCQLVLGFSVALVLSSIHSAPVWWVLVTTVFGAGYINVANFMDGLNGISGIHGTVSGLFYVVLGELTDHDWLTVIGGITAAAYVAFLPWNLLRQGTFLGDSGSYLLGSLGAFTAVAAWASGINPVVAAGPAIIYCLDAGGTLLGRLLRREKWLEPHRSHVYQRLTVLGLSHLSSSTLVGIFSAMVAGLSLVLLQESFVAHVVALSLMAVLCLAYWLLPQVLRVFTARRSTTSEGTVGAT